MDSSNTQGVNGAHMHQQYHGNPPYSNFLNDIEAYANDDSVPGNDDFANFSWDPALFAGTETGSGFSQQQQQQQQQPQQTQPMQTNLNPTLTRQSNSPALQHQQPAHSQYPQHNYGHSLYEHRNMAQPSFDDRFMSRPSASPISFEHHQPFQQMQFNNYGFQQQYPRQSSPPNPYYGQRTMQQPQPQPQPIMPMASRQQSQMSQTPQMDNIHMHQFPAGQRITHTFVNPSMVNSSHMVAMNSNQPQNSNAPPRQQQYQPSQYFQKTGQTVDPQILHPMQMQNYSPMPTPTPQIPQQSSTSQHHQPQIQPASQAPIFQVTNQEAPTTKPTPASKAPKDPNAPKKSRAKTTKTKKDGVTGSESSDELEIEDEPPEVKPALLVVSPPTDERGRALYNAVEAVWYPRNKTPQAEDVRRGIAAFGETVRSLRDAWKAKNDSLKKAELPNSGTATEIPRLKEDVAHYRQTMESVMSRSLQYGHDAIVKRLGDNQFTLSALYSFLLDRANVMDYESTLVTSIFKFAAKFETLDEEMLEQVKWTRVLQRWTKKGTSESRGYAQQIIANAQTQSTRKKIAKAEGVPGSPSSVTGVKRPRDGDTATIPVPKKVVKPSSKPLALQSAERRKALEKESLQKAGLSKGDKSAGTSVTARPKVAMTAPPKANAFIGLISASKKPGTSIAEKAAAAAATTTATKDKPSNGSAIASVNGHVAAVKKEEVKKESPPRSLGPTTNKSASSFLGFLADMDKPKETETKKIEIDPNETEAQRAARLRKEKRRKLRVTWKPDEDLVQVKMFTHDPEEETGQTDSMMRDAGDTMKEGEMLKRHMAMEDDDDEEDEDVLEDLVEYISPSEVDFSTIDAEGGGNFIKFGGSAKPESAASNAQAKYEEETLMTTYTLKSDRPDTPKELPSINDDDDFSPVVDFGEPGNKVRAKERELLAKNQPKAPLAANHDLAAQLRALGMQQQQQTVPQAPATPYNPYEQQSMQQPAAPQIGAGYDISRLLAVVQQAKQINQPPPQQPAYQAPATSIPPNIAAILAQVSGQQNQALPLGNSGNPNPFPGNTEDFNRKHGRGDEGSDQPSNKKKKKGGDNKPYNYKTVVCSFWQEGKCTKGDSCTYKHEL